GPAANYTTVAPTVPPPTAVDREADPTFGRPITALTGAAGPMAATTVATDSDPLALAQTPEPAVSFAPTPTLQPAAAPDVSAGPRLDLTIAADGPMVATLDGESEPIKIKDLRDAAKVLARVHGSAVV